MGRHSTFKGNLVTSLICGVTRFRKSFEAHDLGLPYVKAGAGSVTKWTHNADGVKLSREATAGAGARMDYVGNLVLRDESLDRILIPGGYVWLPEGMDPVYCYNVTDHLGSVRMVVDEAGTPLQVNHFDPFGNELDMSLASNLIGSDPVLPGTTDINPYKFGGKEWDAILSAYDFSARMYNPSFGRFTTMDPLCEKYFSVSPYAYCNNNPVRFIDPFGLTYYSVDGEMRWINDWSNETLTISQQEFDWLSKVYNPENMEIYNAFRSSYKDRYGYIDEDGNQVLAAAKVSEERSVGSGWQMVSLALAWESAVLDYSGDYFYSELMQQWRGKDGIARSMSFNGNQFTGGKNKFAKTLSKKMKNGGYLFGAISMGADVKSLLFSSNSEEAVRAGVDVLVDAVGFSPECSVVPLIWQIGGKWYFYNVVVPGFVEQQEAGVLGLPSTQPFK